MTENLLPCPFCGGKARITLEEEDKPNECFHNVYCKSCDAQFWVNSKSMAIEKWNTRTDNWTKFTIGKNEEGIDVYDCPLPEDEQEVLITDGKSVWQDTAMSDCDGFYFDGGDEIIKEITHWQPLPQPPKGF